MRHKKNDIEELLDKTELEYEKDDDDDYQIVMSVDDDDERTQLVVINGETDELDDTSVYVIWSKAADIEDVDSDDFEDILGKNSECTIGAWEISNENLIFSVKVPTSVEADELEEIISYVAITADEMEQEYSDDDDN